MASLRVRALVLGVLCLGACAEQSSAVNSSDRSHAFWAVASDDVCQAGAGLPLEICR